MLMKRVLNWLLKIREFRFSQMDYKVKANMVFLGK